MMSRVINTTPTITNRVRGFDSIFLLKSMFAIGIVVATPMKINPTTLMMEYMGQDNEATVMRFIGVGVDTRDRRAPT